MGYITKEKLIEIANTFKTNYGDYLMDVAKEKDNGI